MSLDRGELAIAAQLEQAGLTRPSALLAVVMVTRGHARPERELIEIVRQYPSLELMQDARAALRELVARGWLETSVSYGRQILHQVPDLRTRISHEIGDSGVADRLLVLRASLEPFISVVGPMNDERVYSTFLDLLRSAQQRICLPMLATSPYEETVEILQERARAGVKVQILLGAPELVARWRGETMKSIAAERIAQWRTVMRGIDCAEVRLSSSEREMIISTCAGIDDSIVRLDVYDPYAQRSLEGVMLEIAAPHGLRLNIVEVFFRLFDEAWQKSFRPGLFGRFRWALSRWWQLWLAIGFLVSAVLVSEGDQPYLFNLLLGIGSGVLTPVLLEGLPRIWRWLRPRRRR